MNNAASAGHKPHTNIAHTPHTPHTYTTHIPTHTRHPAANDGNFADVDKADDGALGPVKYHHIAQVPAKKYAPGDRDQVCDDQQ